MKKVNDIFEKVNRGSYIENSIFFGKYLDI